MLQSPNNLVEYLDAHLAAYNKQFSFYQINKIKLLQVMIFESHNEGMAFSDYLSSKTVKEKLSKPEELLREKIHLLDSEELINYWNSLKIKHRIAYLNLIDKAYQNIVMQDFLKQNSSKLKDMPRELIDIVKKDNLDISSKKEDDVFLDNKSIEEKNKATKAANEAFIKNVFNIIIGAKIGTGSNNDELFQYYLKKCANKIILDAINDAKKFEVTVDEYLESSDGKDLIRNHVHSLVYYLDIISGSNSYKTEALEQEEAAIKKVNPAHGTFEYDLKELEKEESKLKGFDAAAYAKSKNIDLKLRLEQIAKQKLALKKKIYNKLKEKNPSVNETELAKFKRQKLGVIEVNDQSDLAKKAQKQLYSKQLALANTALDYQNLEDEALKYLDELETAPDHKLDIARTKTPDLYNNLFKNIRVSLAEKLYNDKKDQAEIDDFVDTVNNVKLIYLSKQLQALTEEIQTPVKANTIGIKYYLIIFAVLTVAAAVIAATTGWLPVIGIATIVCVASMSIFSSKNKRIENKASVERKELIEDIKKVVGRIQEIEKEKTVKITEEDIEHFKSPKPQSNKEEKDQTQKPKPKTVYKSKDLREKSRLKRLAKQKAEKEKRDKDPDGLC